MMLPCLVNEDVALTDCEIDDEFIYAGIFQCPRRLLDTIQGSTQIVIEPKTADGFRAVIEIPADITELYYDAKFSYRAMAVA
jgi:hypothetical protein